MKLVSAKFVLAASAGISAISLVASAALFMANSAATETSARPGAMQKQGQIEKAAKQALAKLPLAFEVNKGQTDARVNFLARGPGYVAFLTPAESTLKLGGSREAGQPAVLRMQLLGANPRSTSSTSRKLQGKVNYLKGVSSGWARNVPTYGKVSFRSVYPGIDMTYYGNQRELEYDFIVAPNADPGKIKLNLEGADRLSVRGNGDLSIVIGDHKMVQRKPQIYQMISGHRQAVAGRFVLGGKTVSFDIGGYNHSKALIIDPVLSYRSYLGGAGVDVGFGVAVDAAGAAYVTGATLSSNFPTVGAVTACAGAFITTSFQCDKGASDAFVTKVNPGGGSLAWSTYLGGDKDDQGWDLKADAAGNVQVVGSTLSGTDDPGTVAVEAPFPTTANAYDTTCGTDGSCNAPSPDPTNPSCSTPSGCPRIGFSDTFVSRLSPSGDSLVYSTFLGGGDSDQDLNPSAGALPRMGIALRGPVAYVTGITASSDFPTTSTGKRHCGGQLGVALGCNGKSDAFLSLIDTSKSGGKSLTFSTYVGGDGEDQGNGVTVDSKGDAYVAGTTFGFPVNPLDPTSPLINNFLSLSTLQPTYGGGSSDGFVAKFATSALVANGSVTLNNLSLSGAVGAGSMIYSTYLGGGGGDEAWDVAVKGTNAYVAGYTESGDDPATPAADGPKPYFPTTPGAYDGTYNGRPYAADGSTAFQAGDAFVAELKPAGDGLAYSTFLGGGSGDVGLGIAVDSAGNAYVTGYTHCETPVAHVGPIVSSIQIGFPQSGNGTSRTGTATASTSAVYTVHARAFGSNAGTSDPPDLPARTLVKLTATPDPISGKTVVFSNSTDTITVPVDALGNASDTLTPVSATGAGIAIVRAELASDPGTFATGVAEWGYPDPRCTSDFPTTAGAPQPAINGDYLGNELHNSPADGFLTKLNPSGSGLVYSTFLGGNDFDRSYSVAIRELPGGNEAYVTGRTGSTLIGTTGSAYASKPSGKGNRDAYIAKITEP